MELKPAKMTLTTRDERVYGGLKAAHMAGTPFVTGGAPYLVVSLNVWFDGLFAARAELVEFKQIEWNGEGLPPVGTVCEVQTWVNREWRKTTVLAHHLGFAVHSWSTDGDDIEVEVAPAADFRPIRTPEQIAAEEQEKIEEEIQRICVDGENNGVPFFRALYDAGYRKQVAE